MEKLSDSARLYLKDYYILSNLQDEIHVFFDEILSEFNKKLKKLFSSINKSDISWVNNSTKGELQIYPDRIYEIKDKSNIKMPYIKYADARHIKNEFPDKILLSVIPTKDATAQKTKDLILDIDKTILNNSKITIDENSKEETVARLLKEIMKIMNKFQIVIDQINIQQ